MARAKRGDDGSTESLVAEIDHLEHLLWRLGYPHAERLSEVMRRTANRLLYARRSESEPLRQSLTDQAEELLLDLRDLGLGQTEG